jgi:hypothetical protein
LLLNTGTRATYHRTAARTIPGGTTTLLTCDHAPATTGCTGPPGTATFA